MVDKAKTGRSKKEVILELLKWLIEKEEESHKTYLKHTHGVYRDEVKQFRAEVEQQTYKKVYDYVNELREQVYVSKPGGVAKEIRREGRTEEEAKRGVEEGLIDST